MDLERLPCHHDPQQQPLLQQDSPGPPVEKKAFSGCSTARPKLRDVTLGFLLASLLWTAPRVTQLIWSCTKRPLAQYSESSSLNRLDPFPSGGEIGFQGPTKAGKEPFAAVTAPLPPHMQSHFPVNSPIDSNSSSSFDPIRSWGYLSPFYSLPPHTFGLSSASARISEECQLKQVHLVHRHGARYPTRTKEPAGFSRRLKAVKNYRAKGRLAFLNAWEYSLGYEVLTPLGRNQLFNLGVGFRQKYGRLLDGLSSSTKLVFRTTSQHRMLHSALNFAAGFFGLPFEQQYHQSIIIEAEGFNNSLAPYFTCSNSNEASETYTDKIVSNWSEIYLADSLRRLQPDLEGYQLTIEDLVSMQQLCAYETVSLGWSDFCALFTEDEFKGFSYYSDLTFWYAYSFGSPSAAALGKGWVQELVSRLSKKAISTYDSSTNATLDSNSETFPLDQPIYVDATHDTVISSIIVALNLTTLAAEGPLPTTYIPNKQSFISGHICPFAANLQAQVVECHGREQIRFLLNDAPVPLTGLEGCTPNDQGFCPLQTVINSLTARMNEIDYMYDCNGHYNYSPPIGGGGISNGRPLGH